MNSDDKENHRRMIANAIKQVTQQDKSLNIAKTPEQLCLEHANSKMNAVAVPFVARLKTLPRRPEYHEVVELMYPMIRQEFATWSKDDFATLACMYLAIQSAQALKDASIIA